MTTLGSRRRIILINRYFYPDQAPTGELLSSLGFALVTQGFRVEVITSRLRYEEARASLRPRETIRGVEIWRVWTCQWGRQNLLGRIFDYISFYLSAAWRLLQNARTGDIIIAKTDPPLLSVVIAPLAWWRGCHLVNWLQDLFPEVAVALNVGGRLGAVFFRIARPFRNWSLKEARTNVVVGRSMADRLLEQGIARKKIRIIENWAEGDLIRQLAPPENELRKDWGLEDRFVVGYAGNLGRAHDLDTIIEAMRLLQERANTSNDDVAARVSFLFVGGGAQFPKLEREILHRQLSNVSTRPYQPRDRLAQTLGVADLHLVSLNPKLEGLVFPSKFYGIAAAGRPMIYIGARDGELACLIEDIECGFTVEPRDGEMLVARILLLASDPALRQLMGARARAAFERRWDQKQAITKWIEILDESHPTASKL
jgi:glycosyltransferase involved in cell wall biosynthesis